MKKTVVAGILAIASAVLALPATPVRAAVIYTVTGTVVDDPQQLGTLSGQTFSFTYTSPTFISSVLADVPVSGCTISGSDFHCNQASFRPNEDKGIFGFYDQVDFQWINNDGSGSGGAQILFALGVFSAPGVYNVAFPDLSVSKDAVLTVAVTDVGETPIPGALPLFATGLGAFGLLGWRKRRNGKASAV